MYSQNRAALYFLSIIFDSFVFFTGSRCHWWSCWLQHSETLYMNMVKWKIKHIYVCFRKDCSSLCLSLLCIFGLCCV